MLDQDLINRTKEEMAVQIKREEEERERQEGSRIDVHALTTEEAIAFAKLKKAGFEEVQTKSMLRLIRKDMVMTVDEILNTFDPELDLNTIDVMVDLILKKNR